MIFVYSTDFFGIFVYSSDFFGISVYSPDFFGIFVYSSEFFRNIRYSLEFCRNTVIRRRIVCFDFQKENLFPLLSIPPKNGSSRQTLITASCKQFARGPKIDFFKFEGGG